MVLGSSISSASLVIALPILKNCVGIVWNLRFLMREERDFRVSIEIFL
jgi:hypothetical protein